MGILTDDNSQKYIDVIESLIKENNLPILFVMW